MTKKQKLKVIEDELKNFEISPNDKCYTPAKILLASLVCGPNTDKIAKFINEPRLRVRPIGKIIRESGIWKRDKVCCEWFDENGGIAFLLDVNVASGFMKRLPYPADDARGDRHKL